MPSGDSSEEENEEEEQSLKAWTLRELSPDCASFECGSFVERDEELDTAATNEEDADGEADDLEAFSAQCRSILLDHIDTTALQQHLESSSSTDAVFPRLLVPVAVVVCENDYVESLVCDRLEFELDNYLLLSGVEQWPRTLSALLQRAKREAKPVVLFTYCGGSSSGSIRIDSVVSSLVRMHRTMAASFPPLKLVFVTQSADFIASHVSSDTLAWLDVCLFHMETVQALFSRLVHALFVGGGSEESSSSTGGLMVRLPVLTINRLVHEFDWVDHSLPQFIQRVHYERGNVVVVVVEEERDEFGSVCRLLLNMARRLSLVPSSSSVAAASKWLLASSSLRWKELRVRVLASSAATVSELFALDSQLLMVAGGDGGEEDGDGDAAAAEEEEAASSSIARHKMGAKMRRAEAFKAAARVSSSAAAQRLCRAMDRVLARVLLLSHNNNASSSSSSSALTAPASWPGVLRPALDTLSQSSSNAHVCYQALVLLPTTTTTTTTVMIVDLVQWYESFSGELGEEDLGRFVRAMCELRVLGVWDWYGGGRDRVKRLV